jgi:hypothetical protein
VAVGVVAALLGLFEAGGVEAAACGFVWIVWLNDGVLAIRMATDMVIVKARRLVWGFGEEPVFTLVVFCMVRGSAFGLFVWLDG